MDDVDLASLTIEEYISSQPRVSAQDWKLLVEIGDDWESIPFTGTPSEAADLLSELIDRYNGRWARGHGSTFVAASDGDAEAAWRQHFGDNQS